MKKLSKKTTNLNVWDIGLVKLAIASMTLFVVTVWSGAMNWVNSVHWGWFLAVGVIAGLRPLYRFWIKK